MHVEAREFVTRVAYEHGPWNEARVIECGSLNVNGSVRDLFAGSLYTGVDIVAGRDVEVLCNFANYRLPDLATRADLVICCEVLEHTPEHVEIIATARDCLKPGGLFLVTCATEGRAPHGAQTNLPLEAEFYENVGANELANAIADGGFSILKLEVHADRGDLYLLASRGSDG